MLYLIPFLHQTTTVSKRNCSRRCCILFHFYIKPQLGNERHEHVFRCILFHFYIKPQLFVCLSESVPCCILFHFYIKPQHLRCFPRVCSVVSYSISTSNHNDHIIKDCFQGLYLIPFLHQTTTKSAKYTQLCGCILFHFYIKPQLMKDAAKIVASCILFHFYIKPQQLFSVMKTLNGCILFHFYIKPQQINAKDFGVPVVSYSISTSNHNPMAHKTLFSSTLSPKSHSHFQRNAVV